MNYIISLRQFPDGEWEACIPKLGLAACVATGKDPNQAVKRLLAIRDDIIAMHKEQNIPLPPEDEDESI